MKGFCKICGKVIDEVIYSQFGCCEECYSDIDKKEKRIKCIKEHFCKAYQSDYDEGYGNCNVLSDCEDFHREAIGEPEGLSLFPKKEQEDPHDYPKETYKKPDWEITKPLGKLKEFSLINRVAKASCGIFAIVIIVLILIYSIGGF